MAAEYGAPNWDDRKESLYDGFCAALLRANPDFQTDPAKNYDRDEPGKANLSICASQITVMFDCFAGTLEQPFIDTESEFPQKETGWSPERSRKLGASLLDAFLTLL